MPDADPAGVFEPMYAAAAAGEARLPWDRGGPHPLIEAWGRGRDGAERRALVVGSGLGTDAAFLADLGYDVLGFDVSSTAVATARERYASPKLEFRIADLLELPAEWRQAFDLVVESLTVQSLPPHLHPAAIASVAATVAPGGTLLVVATARDDGAPPDGPPWPLTRAEVERFGEHGLEAAGMERVREPDAPDRWRAEFRRP